MSGFNSQLSEEKGKVSQMSYRQLRGKQLVDSLKYELMEQGRLSGTIKVYGTPDNDLVGMYNANTSANKFIVSRMTTMFPSEL